MPVTSKRAYRCCGSRHGSHVRRCDRTDGGSSEPSLARKLFIEAHAAICVPSTEKRSSCAGASRQGQGAPPQSRIAVAFVAFSNEVGVV